MYGIPFDVDESVLSEDFTVPIGKAKIEREGWCILLNHEAISKARVAKFACPRVLDDQNMSEDNLKLRCGCPLDYQILWGIKIT